MANRDFTPFPVLTTERLTLRKLSVEDLQDIFELRSNPEINKYLDREPSRTITDAINFINHVNDNILKNNSIYWVITVTSTKTFVGTICFFSFSKEENKCEIGFELLTKFQGKGIMKEAVEKVIDYAFQTVRLIKIEAVTHHANLNSVRLLQKLNFIKSPEPGLESPNLNLFSLTNSISNT